MATLAAGFLMSALRLVRSRSDVGVLQAVDVLEFWILERPSQNLVSRDVHRMLHVDFPAANAGVRGVGKLFD